MAETQIRNLEMDIIWRWSAPTKDKYIRRLDVLMPSIPAVSQAPRKGEEMLEHTQVVRTCLFLRCPEHHV